MNLNRISLFLATSVPSFWAPFRQLSPQSQRTLVNVNRRFEVRKGLRIVAFQAYADHLVGF